MKYSLDTMVQRGHAFAIVDEVDSILIDEARTPLIISGPTEDLTEMYRQVDAVMTGLAKDDYDLDEKSAPGHAHRAGQRAYGRDAQGRGPARAMAISTTPRTSPSSITSTRR